MLVLKNTFGRMAELADAYALGAYGVTHQSSTLCSPTRYNTGCFLKIVFQKKVEEVNKNTTKLCCVWRNLCQRGEWKKAVDKGFYGFSSLRN